jgi:predicted HTH transcriptional regulator
MLLSHLKEWTAAEIDLLFEVKPQEGRSIDYKERMPKNLDDILPDISAFANTHGGTIIFGISEEEGLPVNCVGLAIDDTDKEKLNFRA